MGTIGENIKKLREERGLSMNQLAKRIGKSRSAVSQYENEQIVPRMGTIEDIAAALGVNKVDILNDRPYITYYVANLDKTEHDAISAMELELLDTFRALDETGRQAALYAVRGILAAQRQSGDAQGTVAG